MKTRQQCLEIKVSSMQFFAEQLLKPLIKQFHFRRIATSFIDATQFFFFLPLFLSFFTLVEAKGLSTLVSPILHDCFPGGYSMILFLLCCIIGFPSPLGPPAGLTVHSCSCCLLRLLLLLACFLWLHVLLVPNGHP